YAATSAGFLISSDSGATWHKLQVPGVAAVASIAVSERMVVAAGRNAVAVSANATQSWLPNKPMNLDQGIIIQPAAVDSSSNIWLATRDGVYRSTDAGDCWKKIVSLRLSNLANVQFDAETQRILVTGADSNSVYESSDSGRTWTPINSGWPLRN